MGQALILCAVPWEIGGALWVSGPHPFVAAGLIALAVISVMFLGDRHAKAENAIH